MTLFPWLGVAGMIILWHIRFPLLTLIFISVAFSPIQLGNGMHLQTLLSPLLKVPRIVMLSSLLWWELGTNLPGPGPGEWLSFWRVTSKHFWFWFWSVSCWILPCSLLSCVLKVEWQIPPPVFSSGICRNIPAWKICPKWQIWQIWKIWFWSCNNVEILAKSTRN